MWTRRNLIETAALGATGIVVAGRFAGAQTASDSGHVHEDAMWKACGDTCDACAKACNTAFHHCVTLAAAGKAQHAKMAQTVADCAAFCALSAQMLQRGSAFAMLSCTACADACKVCAQECGANDSDHEMMKTCADACRRCEESCRKMVHEAAGARTGAAREGAVERGTGSNR